LCNGTSDSKVTTALEDYSTYKGAAIFFLQMIVYLCGVATFMTKISKLLLEDYVRYDNYVARSVDTNAPEGKGVAFFFFGYPFRR
jgi:hypothetical protein